MEIKQVIDLRRKCVEAYSAVHGLDTLQSLFQVAFPVYMSTWRVKLRIEKSTGLVDRQMLTAVQKFGPISSAAISEMLCLEEAIVENSLQDLASAGVDGLLYEGGFWKLVPGTEIEHFYVEKEHEFGFVSNGLTGDFLPLNRVSACRVAKLTEDEIWKFRLVQLRPMHSSAESPLVKEMRGTKRAHQYAEYGIPDNFLSFEGVQPVKEHVSFILAFVFVDKCGSIEIMPATETGFSFAVPQEFCIPYLKPIRAEKRRPAYDGVEYKDEGDLRFVKVTEKGLWRGDVVLDEKNKDAPSFVAQLKQGWMCETDGSFHRLVPWDDRTMHELALQRGLSLLKRSYGYKRESKDKDLVDFLAERFLVDCKRDFPTMKKCPPFEEVLRLAMSSSDSELAAWAGKFVGREAVVKKVTRPEFEFLSSRGSLFHKTVVDAIDSAKNTIRIVSPVLTEEEVLLAIERAKKRGVQDIRVIMPLSEHRNNIFKTDPEFADYRLPRRQLAEFGVQPRDCEHTVHAKLIAIDSIWSFFTTANLNANSLGVGKADAIESGIVFKDTVATHALEEIFDVIWLGSSYEQTRNDKHITISSRPRCREMRVAECINHARGYAFFLSTPENQLLARRMRALVAEAKKEILILSMSFYDLECVPDLFAELQKALERHVRVKTCVRPGEEMNFSPDDWPDRSTARLLQTDGFDLHVCAHLHAKGMVVDGATVLMTSANFNPYSLGCSQTAHLEMAVVGTISQKPMADFAEFVKDILKESKPIKRRNNGKVSR